MLKRLELIGFKSFAEKTEVAVLPGITCIVGPNGCGKSNVGDAIRWALGEQSPKLLRGQRMEDVIFHGSASRKPIGLAEVGLIFSNDGALQVPWSEVAVARRLYRTTGGRAPARVEPRTVTGDKVGRNDSCPCGSGKKYKKCCLLKGA